MTLRSDGGNASVSRRGRAARTVAALLGGLAVAASAIAPAVASAGVPPAAGAAAAAKPLSHDVNGDGLADVAFTDYIDSIDSPGATVVFGARDRSAPASRAQPGTRGFRITGNGETLSGAEVLGDVNGDGLADVLATTTGEAFVIYGTRTPAAVSLVSKTFAKGVVGRRFDLPYDEIHGAGDVNGDGLADLVYVIAGKRKLARVLLGSKSRPLRTGFDIGVGGRVKRVVNPSLAPVGDTNGDGRDDIAIAVADPNGRRDGFDVEEMVFVVRGKRGLGAVTLTQAGTTSSARVLVSKRAGGFAVAHARSNCWCQVMDLAPAGDLNGDGRGELGITWMDPFKDSRSRIDVVFGRAKSSAVLVKGTAASAGVAATIERVEWSTPFASFGDLDADGRADLVVEPDSASADENHHAGLHLLSGKLARGPITVAERTPPLIGAGEGFIGLAQPAGDLDGDGRRDLLAGYEDRGLSETSFAIVYGAAPLSPVDLTAPGPGVTRLP